MSSISPISPLSPVSPMSPAKTSARPPHLMLNQHSSSLFGMEIAVPSPLTPGFNDFRSSSNKALPPIPRKESASYFTSHSAPTSRKGSFIDSNPKEERPSTAMNPRKASTTYTNLNEERPRTPRSALQYEALSSKNMLVPPGTRSSTSRIPDNVPLRPQLTRGAQTQGASDFTARKQPSGSSLSGGCKAAKHEYSDDEYGSSLPASREVSGWGSWASVEPTRSAEEIAREYQSVLPATVPEPSHSDPGFLPSNMSARITNVFEDSFMPASLVLSSNSEDGKLSSQFSSSDSDSEIESLLNEPKPSLKSRAKKAFKPRKPLRERKENAQADIKVSQHTQAGELRTAYHTSLQNGINEMYGTLTSLYSPLKPKTKQDSAHPGTDPRRPASPLTADGGSNRKGWDPSMRARSPATKREESVGKKLVTVFQNGAIAVGLERGKEQKMKNEEWRAEMKKKIVLIKSSEPNQG